MDSKSSTQPPIDKFILRYYHSVELLEIDMSEGLDYYVEGLKMREEERMFELWSRFKTRLGGEGIPEYNEFIDGMFETPKERRERHRKKREKDEKRKKRGLGTIKGTDLLNM